MELAKGEPASEGFPCAFAIFEDLELAHHQTGLAGIDDVTLDLARFYAVSDPLLASPAFRMDAGIDNETAGTE